MLNLDLVKNNLKDKNIGKEILYFPEIDSTNVFLKNNDFPHGTVVLAGSQTAGKGRRGNIWLDKEGESLLFSLVLDNSQISINTFTLVLGLAVIKTARKYVPGDILKIKWPNDIILNGKKLGGILCEQEKNKLIVGIGLNIYNTDLEGIVASWTSFKRENIDIDVNSFFVELLLKIEIYYDNFKKYDFQYFINDYRDFCVNLNKEVYFRNGEELINAFAKDVSEDGSLLVVKDGVEERLYSGTVSIRGKDGYI